MTDDKIIQGDDSISGDSNIIARLLIGGNVQGNIHIGNTIYHTSEIETLRDYLRRAILTLQTELYHSLLRNLPSNQPYKYLYSYELEDAPLFFGRDAAIQKLRQHISQDDITILHAPSGTGKTSLLKAGLSPLLIREGYLPVYVRVYQDPLLAIKRAFAPPTESPWPAMLSDLSLHGFLGVIYGLASAQIKEIVLIIDQLEELFTSASDELGRRVWIDALGDCYEDKRLPVRFLLGIRDDYLANLAEFEPRFPNIFHNRMRLLPLTRDEAIRAIRDPVTRISPSRHYAPGVAETIINDLGVDKVDTPQLQIVCAKLFDALDSNELEITSEKYHLLGRAETILGDYLRSEVEKFGSNTALARAILIELVSLGSTRRQCTENEISESLAQRPDLEHLKSVLADLINTRLLRALELEGVVRYELAHDYLLGQIQQWVTTEDVRTRQVRDILQRALSNWKLQGWLMDPNAFAFVNAHRELLTNLSAVEAELLLRSAVSIETAVDFWALAALRKGIDIWPVLQPALSAPDHRLRSRLARVLPSLGDVALHGLKEMLSDDFPDVRVAAIRAWHSSSNSLPGNLKYEAFIPPEQNQSGFYMDKYPVTFRDYERFLVENPATDAPPDWDNREADVDRLDHPVTSVSWKDAQAYAQWAGKRLPSAKEWRRAASSGRYPWGDEEDCSLCNTRESSPGSTTPVGLYSPNGDSPFAVSDMAGNVWEWLTDEHSQEHLLLGGCWFYSIEFARVDTSGLWRLPDTRSNFIGFRLCFDL